MRMTLDLPPVHAHSRELLKHIRGNMLNLHSQHITLPRQLPDFLAVREAPVHNLLRELAGGTALLVEHDDGGAEAMGSLDEHAAELLVMLGTIIVMVVERPAPKQTESGVASSPLSLQQT